MFVADIKKAGIEFQLRKKTSHFYSSNGKKIIVLLLSLKSPDIESLENKTIKIFKLEILRKLIFSTGNVDPINFRVFPDLKEINDSSLIFPRKSYK